MLTKKVLNNVNCRRRLVYTNYKNFGAGGPHKMYGLCQSGPRRQSGSLQTFRGGQLTPLTPPPGCAPAWYKTEQETCGFKYTKCWISKCNLLTSFPKKTCYVNCYLVLPESARLNEKKDSTLSLRGRYIQKETWFRGVPMLKSGCMQRFNTNWRKKYWDYSDQQGVHRKAEIRFYWELCSEFKIWRSVRSY